MDNIGGPRPSWDEYFAKITTITADNIGCVEELA